MRLSNVRVFLEAESGVEYVEVRGVRDSTESGPDGYPYYTYCTVVLQYFTHTGNFRT